MFLLKVIQETYSHYTDMRGWENDICVIIPPTRPVPTISTYISYSIVVWFLSAPARDISQVLQIYNITYITKVERKNKQARICISTKCKKGEVLALFWHSVAIASMYWNEIPTQLPGTLTHSPALADMTSGFTSPNSSLQQPSLSDSRLSPTVPNSNLLTARLLPVS